MPELPDVEMTRRDLKRWLVGAMVTAADTEDARLSRPASPRAFAQALVNRIFERVERRGKWLRLDLDDRGKVFSHLGMTGGWVRVAIGAPVVRFERARIDVVLRGRTFSVRYVDARRFGRLLAVRACVGASRSDKTAHPDRTKRRIAITDFGACRSHKTAHRDHRFRRMSIAQNARCDQLTG